MSTDYYAWHYTIGKHYERIIADGVIRPATASVPAHERPIVWFSLNQWWEETANKAVLSPDGEITDLDMKGTAAEGGGLVRIGVALDRAPYPWSTLKRLAGISNKVARAMVEAAREAGADPLEWRGTFDPVPRSDWLAVQTFAEDTWRDADSAG